MINEIICTLEKEGFSARCYPGTRGDKRAVICAAQEGFTDAFDFLRDAGYTVLGLDMTRQCNSVSVDRVQQAMCWLKARYDIDQIAVTGTSLGGQYALLAASLIPGIACVIPVAPFDYICRDLLYTRHGLNLPYTAVQHSALRKQIEYNEMSRIPYQNMKSDILLLGVRNDEFWPSCEAVSRIENRLREIKYSYRMETHICDCSAQIESSHKRIIDFLDT